MPKIIVSQFSDTEVSGSDTYIHVPQAYLGEQTKFVRANCYISFEDANRYFQTRSYAEDWFNPPSLSPTISIPPSKEFNLEVEHGRIYPDLGVTTGDVVFGTGDNERIDKITWIGDRITQKLYAFNKRDNIQGGDTGERRPELDVDIAAAWKEAAGYISFFYVNGEGNAAGKMYIARNRNGYGVISSPTTFADFKAAVIAPEASDQDLKTAVKDRYTSGSLTSLDDATLTFRNNKSAMAFKTAINNIPSENLTVEYEAINTAFSITGIKTKRCEIHEQNISPAPDTNGITFALNNSIPKIINIPNDPFFISALTIRSFYKDGDSWYIMLTKRPNGNITGDHESRIYEFRANDDDNNLLDVLGSPIKRGITQGTSMTIHKNNGFGWYLERGAKTIKAFSLNININNNFPAQLQRQNWNNLDDYENDYPVGIHTDGENMYVLDIKPDETIAGGATTFTGNDEYFTPDPVLDGQDAVNDYDDSLLKYPTVTLSSTDTTIPGEERIFAYNLKTRSRENGRGAITREIQENALITASKLIDISYALPGRKIFAGQNLEWPRWSWVRRTSRDSGGDGGYASFGTYGLIARSGLWVYSPGGKVPKVLRDAVCETALIILRSDFLKDAITTDDRHIDSISASSVSISFSRVPRDVMWIPKHVQASLAAEGAANIAKPNYIKQIR